MKVVAQRVLNAKVEVNKNVVGEIKEGLLLFVGFKTDDTEKEIDWMINKVLNLRVFDDKDKVPNLSVKDINGEILSVSQFTLYADPKKGNRPSYINAMNEKEARCLYELFNKKLKENDINVQEGIFREDMKVSLTNDGPFTIIIEK